MERAATQETAATAGGARARGTAAAYAVALALLFVAPGPVFVAALFAAAVGLLATPVVYGLRRERFRRHLRKVAFRTAFLLLAWGLTVANWQLAEARLERLVDAMHAYHAEWGAYPDDLAALAPAYIERVPRATLWLTMNRFHWNPDGLLTCVPVPPIGWIGHDFRTDERVELD